MSAKIITGDCRNVLTTLPDESVHCIVTSPPYFGLRDYGNSGQMGLEPTPSEFVDGLVSVFREARRVLRSDGTLWLNLGDSYASAWVCNRRSVIGSGSLEDGRRANRPNRLVEGLKEKDLIGIPWRVAFALQADGWYLRQDIIWSKPNPMPESVRDRCAKAHEYLFLLSKNKRYHFDSEAITEPLAAGSADRYRYSFGGPKTDSLIEANQTGIGQRTRVSGERNVPTGRNKRSVWSVPTSPYKGAHFATFPPALIEPCILAGCPEGGTVLDPFGGAGTTGLVAERLGRNSILIELNADYVAIAQARIDKDADSRAAKPDMFSIPVKRVTG